MYICVGIPKVVFLPTVSCDSGVGKLSGDYSEAKKATTWFWSTYARLFGDCISLKISNNLCMNQVPICSGNLSVLDEHMANAAMLQEKCLGSYQV